MGVDYYPCSNCGETFPDCGPYHICGQEHMLCANCMRNVPEARDTDENGWFHSKHCPTCAKGGSTRQRLAKAEERNATLRLDLIAALDQGAEAESERDAAVAKLSAISDMFDNDDQCPVDAVRAFLALDKKLEGQLADSRELAGHHHDAWTRAADENGLLRERLGMDPMLEIDDQTAGRIDQLRAEVGKGRALLEEVWDNLARHNDDGMGGIDNDVTRVMAQITAFLTPTHPAAPEGDADV